MRRHGHENVPKPLPRGSLPSPPPAPYGANSRPLSVKVRLQSSSQPIEFEATGAYEKGLFYCVLLGQKVIKYPIANLYSVEEDYGYHAPKIAENFVGKGP